MKLSALASASWWQLRGPQREPLRYSQVDPYQRVCMDDPFKPRKPTAKRLRQLRLRWRGRRRRLEAAATTAPWQA